MATDGRFTQSALFATNGLARGKHSPSERPRVATIFAALDASLVLDVRWRAGALDRLIDEAHAALGGSVAELLTRLGWIVRVEVTYSEYGERGSIDLVAFWPASGILLVVELKTDLPGIDPVLRKLDEKSGWRPRSCASGSVGTFATSAGFW